MSDLWGSQIYYNIETKVPLILKNIGTRVGVSHVLEDINHAARIFRLYVYIDIYILIPSLGESGRKNDVTPPEFADQFNGAAVLSLSIAPTCTNSCKAKPAVTLPS